MQVGCSAVPGGSGKPVALTSASTGVPISRGTVVRTPDCTMLRMLDAMLNACVCAVAVSSQSYRAMTTPRRLRHTVLAISVYAAGLAHVRALQLVGHIPHPVGQIQDVWLSRPSHAVSSVAKQPLWIPLARITCVIPHPDSRMSCPMTRKCFLVRSHAWRSPEEHTQPCQRYSASLT